MTKPRALSCADFCTRPSRSSWMLALLRAAPALRRGLYARPRLFSSSPALLVKSGKVVKAPRWVNSRQPQDIPPAQEEEDPTETDEPTESPESLSSSSESSSSTAGDASSSASPPSNPPPPSTPGSIAKQSVPEIYPQVLALPIARRPLFPGFYKAVVVRNPGVVAAIKEMMKRGQPYLGAFLLKDENTDSDVITDINSVHEVGVFAQITSVFAAVGRGEDDKEEGLTAVLYPHRRIKITELVKAGPAKIPPQTIELPTPSPSPPPDRQVADQKSGTFRVFDVSSHHTNYRKGPVQTAFLHKHDISIVNVENLITLPYSKDDQYIRAFMSEIVSVFKDIAQLNPLFRDQITNFSINQVAANVFDEPDKLADFAAAVSTGEVQELQDVLESLVVDDRLRKALLVLKKELINAQLQSKLSRDVDSKIAKRQREYYLMEQLKGIKKELGMESDGKDKLIEKFRERAASLKMPEVVRKVFEEELAKLQGLEPAASEANVTRNYLDRLTQV